MASVFAKLETGARLPLEVIEHIISCVSAAPTSIDDALEAQCALHRIALTCRAFHSIANQYLHHRLVIAGHKSYRLWAHKQCSTKQVDGQCYREAWVQEDDIPFVHELPFTATHLGASLQSVHLSGVNWSKSHPPPLMAMAITRFKHVSKLVLHNFTFSSLRQFHCYVSAHPKLSMLELRNVTWQTFTRCPVIILNKTKKYPQVKELAFYWGYTNLRETLTCFANSDTLEHIERLKMEDFGTERLSEVSTTFLRNIGYSLEHLELDLWWCSMGPPSRGVLRSLRYSWKLITRSNPQLAH